MLPILYDITIEELARKDLAMAEFYSLRADKGIPFLVEQLINEIAGQKQKEAEGKKRHLQIRQRKVQRLAWLVGIVLLIVVAGIVGYQSLIYRGPSTEIVDHVVLEHVDVLQRKANLELNRRILSRGGTVSSAIKAGKLYADFNSLNAYYRNEYTLDNGSNEIHSRTHVSESLNVDVGTLRPENLYRFKNPAIYQKNTSENLPLGELAGMNLEAVKFKTTSIHELPDGRYEAEVEFQQNVRLIITRLTFMPSSNGSKGMKKQEVLIIAHLPTEHFVFEERRGEWNAMVAPIR